MPPRVVVGGALVRDGRLLAARRTAPASVAGRWEFPGGKVEPGEDLGAALRRELVEELGLHVRPGSQVGPDVQVAPGLTLRVLWCTDAGPGSPEPVPTEHDALRWLARHELFDVPWIEADLPVVTAVARALGHDAPVGD